VSDVEHFSDLRDEVDRAAQRYADLLAERDRLRAAARMLLADADFTGALDTMAPVPINRLVALKAALDGDAGTSTT
jgi:hypothetical protein